jgi:hypothetical protein
MSEVVVTLLPVFVGVRRFAAASGVALLLVVTSCSSSSDQPRQLPPLSTTPVVSTTSPAVLDKKAALAEAEAVVREYFRLLNRLHRGVDERAFTELETPSCPCKKFLVSLRQVQARGDRYFGHATLRGVTPTRDSNKLIEVLASYDSSRGGIRNASGDVVTSSPGRQDVTELFYVRFD